MEASDAFSQSVEIGDKEDPFEGSDFGDFGEQNEPGGPVEELPVVNKEGERIEPTDEGGEAPGTPDAAPAPLQAPDAASTESAEGEAAADPPQAAEAAPAPAEHAQEAVAEPEPAPAVHESQAPAVEAAPPAEVEDAPPPPEKEDAKGNTTHRRYVILRADGQGKFTQVHWYEDPNGKMTESRTGAKRQAVALARGTEEALKIGYAAVGAPKDGATLVAVAALYFQPRKVKPLPPEPSKQRLQIS